MLNLNLLEILRCIYSLKKVEEAEFFRYSKTKNTYLNSYDPKQKSKHIKHLDTNNLCGYGMSKFPPTSSFKWIDPKEFHLNKYTSNTYKGCVDLEYPKELRELHND